MRRIVARGSIRVDARRAAAKLREHLLTDLHAYTLELARAASALGAKKLDVRWDADDVVVSFDSNAIERERLAHLLDFALAESEDASDRALRTLALGVNAALGLGAAHVSVLASDQRGAWQTSWNRAALDQAEAGQRSDTEPKDVALPPDAFPRGVQVSVHRGLGLEVFKRALLGDQPREVALLAESTHGSELEIRVNGAPIARSARPRALLRARLDLPEARTAAIELLSAGESSSFELSERGVRLLHNVWTPWPSTARAVPLRWVVDADELPTNASRSALRHDSPLALALGSAAEEGLRRVLAALGSKVCGSGELPDSVEILEPDETRLEDALGALACAAAAVARSGEPLSEDLETLLSLPLVHGVGGRRITPRELLLARSVYVWRNAEPLPEELAPWLGSVVWLRGRAVERMLEGMQLADASELVKLARTGSARRRQLLAHPASEPVVPPSVAAIARQSFALDASPFAGLRGEIVLLAPIGDKPRPSLLRLFVEQRLIEAIAIEPSFLPLAIDTAVSWPEFLRPRFDYSGVERNPELSHAVYALVSRAIGMADLGASELGGLPPKERASFEVVLRGAIAAFSLVPTRLGFVVREPGSFEKQHPRLFTARVFPTPNARQRVSLSDLTGYARRTGVLAVAKSWHAVSGAVPPDGRPVLVAGNEEIEAVRAALSVQVNVVSYEPAARGRVLDDPGERRAALTGFVRDEVVRQSGHARAPMSWLEQPDFVAVVAPGLEARVIESHRGVVLRSSSREKGALPLIIAYDDQRTVPTSDWDGVVWAPTRWHASLESRFLESLVAALEGDRAALEQLGTDFDSRDPALVALLVGHAAALATQLAKGEPKPTDDQLRAFVQRIEALPLLTWADADGTLVPTSIAAVAEKHTAGVPLLAEAPGFASLDWWPVVSESELVRSAVARRFPKAELASAELELRRAKAKAVEIRRRLLALPGVDLGDLTGLVSRGDHITTLAMKPRDESGSDLAISIGLPKPDLDFAAPWLLIHFQGRFVCGVGWKELLVPVAGRLDTSSDDDLDAWTKPSAAGWERMRMRVLEAAGDLAMDLVADAQGPGASGKLLADHRALNLCHAVMRLGAGALLEIRLLSDDFLWPTVQGGEARLTDLKRTDNKLWVGNERYPRWQRHPSRETDLDRPILYAPLDSTANALASVLAALGFELLDVTGALSRLQADRQAGAPARPSLGGIPAHAALRADLASLGFALGDGELELADAPSSPVTLFLIDGTRRDFSLDLACPVRAVLRVDALDSASVASALGPALEAATEHLVQRIAPQLSQLPAFVRRSVRALVLAGLAAGHEIASELVELPVFEDTAGSWHALSDLVRAQRWTYTTLAPPFPTLPAPCLLLDGKQAESLAASADLTLADRVVARARAGELRRNAPGLPRIELGPEDRVACLLTAPFATATAVGELGVLVPRHIERRGVQLHVGRRLLCTLDDGPGWPIVASVDDDSLETDPWFERATDEGATARLCDALKNTARAALQRTFAPPATALAARWLDDEPAGELRVTGVLWLPGSFPTTPAVRVHTADQGVPFVRALTLPPPRSAILPALPVEGDLLVRRLSTADEIDPTMAREASWEALGALGGRLALELLSNAQKAGLGLPVLEEHAWSLGLLGLDATPPPARAADGRSLGPAEIVAELADKGAIWVSDGGGWVEGAFPGQMPGFVLSESETRLLRVLELRALPSAVRRLGGVAAQAPSAGLDTQPKTPATEPPVSATRAVEGATIWQGVREKLGGLWGGAEPASVPHPELAALERLLASFALTGDPIHGVLPAHGRRAFRYDATTLSVLVAQHHPAIAALLARGASDPRAVALLAAAALSEVNRALTEVTDAEERRALVALLQEL